MVSNPITPDQTSAVLFSAGLDSAVLLASALERGGAVPIYVRAGLAWETQELETAQRLLRAPAYAGASPLVELGVDMRDVFPPTHWAVRGEAPGFDTPDEDVYIDGRNIVLLAKASVFMARRRITRVLLGPLAGNPFPDATPEFLDLMARALSSGLAASIAIETPFSSLHKADVVALGARLGVPFELTMSCMQPVEGRHCGRCSKCRERRDGFIDAGVPDPTEYATAPAR